VITSAVGCRTILLAALLALALQPAAAAFAQQATSGSAAASAPQQDPEADTVAAPVVRSISTNSYGAMVDVAP
jgi:hypothetical protein